MSPHKEKSTYKPFAAYKMTATLKNLYYKMTPTSSSAAVPTLARPGEFSKARTEDALFPTTDPAVDGDDCLHDCATCTIKYPSKFTIDETEELFGHVKGWSTHLIVATGKTDWVRDVADEKGSIMEAVDRGDVQPSNGKLMLSASNIPIPEHSDHSTSVLLLPAWQYIDNVTVENTPEVITKFVNTGPTNSTPLSSASAPKTTQSSTEPTSEVSSADPATTTTPPTIPTSPSLHARPCPHKYLILLCSQKTRDARCGQSAPLLRRELERHLRPLGLYRDMHDERPGGVGIYFISHVGGHKFSANVMVYRRSDAVERPKQTDAQMSSMQDTLEKLNVEDEKGQQVLLDVNKAQEEEGNGEAAQCIWLARIRPEDCENVIKFTVLQGKVVKPKTQLRGGFDRAKQVASW